MMDNIFNFFGELLWDLADLVGMTYKELNVWIFGVIWPALTIALCINNIRLRKKIKDLKK